MTTRLSNFPGWWKIATMKNNTPMISPRHVSPKMWLRIRMAVYQYPTYILFPNLLCASWWDYHNFYFTVLISTKSLLISVWLISQSLTRLITHFLVQEGDAQRGCRRQEESLNKVQFNGIKIRHHWQQDSGTKAAREGLVGRHGKWRARSERPRALES